jgi:hypothetical protein
MVVGAWGQGIGCQSACEAFLRRTRAVAVAELPDTFMTLLTPLTFRVKRTMSPVGDHVGL